MSTKQERAQQKRDETIARFNSAIDAIQSSGSFTAWLAMRAKFRSYSFRNTVLIWAQRPDATQVAGFRAWQDKFGRQVKKGEKGIVIFTPLLVRTKPGDEDYAIGDDGKPVRRMRGFSTATVFDVSQTEGAALPQPPAVAEINGQELAHCWPLLTELASSLDYSVSVEGLSGPDGVCRRKQKAIAIEEGLSVNGRVATLVHELVHAMGVDYSAFTRPQAETIAEGTAYVVCSGLGLDMSGSSVPYVAGWSSAADREFALAHIDYYAARIERALDLTTRAPALPAKPELPAENAPVSQAA